MIDRRALLLSSGLLLVTGCMAPSRWNGEETPQTPILDMPEIRKIEAHIGGRLGVALVDGEGALIMSHRGSERFAMCSTFKAALASALFAAHEAGAVDMFVKFPLKPSDGVPYMPFVEKKLAAKEPVSLHELAGAAIITSDNAAANLVLKAIGGPEQFTNFVRTQGDGITRLDRMEPELNENIPGDPRDSTSPEAMGKLMQKLAIADAALDIDKLTLQKWMKDCKTGAKRIRAGLPKSWQVGDKTGTAPGGIAVNDIAIFWPSNAKYAMKPAILTVYTDRPTAVTSEVEAAIADVARIAAGLIALPE
ncbi:MAG: class A beta-lactamase [Parasphingorhabdus sp.]|uniref:class A beta-lactamase n=1 Tax=Parasphingorhabdus sp. TaxID=2709688 RepID=UPI00300151FC